MSVTESDCWFTATTVPVRLARRAGWAEVAAPLTAARARAMTDTCLSMGDNVACASKAWQADCDEGWDSRGVAALVGAGRFTAGWDALAALGRGLGASRLVSHTT